MPGSPQDPRSGEPAPKRDDVHAQRARIVAFLRANGPTSCADLAAACDVPSVTKRVCELIEIEGCPIERIRGHVRTRQGARRRATFYSLSGTPAQRDLFEPA